MLKTALGKLKLENPLILASGILGSDDSMLKRVAQCSIGAVTMKSIGPKERFGNPNPSVVEWEHGFINAVGLPSPGIDNAKDELEQLARMQKAGKPWIASCYASSAAEFAAVAKKLAAYMPAMLEIDISCPHYEYGRSFAADGKLAGEVVKAVKKAIGSIPLSVKLSPNVTDIAGIGKAAEQAGADVLNAINTLKGMVIDIDARRPVLANRHGGISGPALKPVAVRCVYDLYENVKIPIIGTGGVTTGRDAIEMLMAGASAVGVGTAVWYRGIEAFDLICKEMEDWMKENNVSSVKELVGVGH